MPRSRERDPTPPSLLIAAHCSTIQRTAKRLDTFELSAIFDDLVRELNTKNLRPSTYLNSLNEVVKILNSTTPTVLTALSSHYIFVLIRNNIRNLLQFLSQSKRLTNEETYALRNCVLLLNHLVEQAPDVSKVLHWLTDATLLDALANCLNHLDQISKKDRHGHAVKQITRLLNIFCIIQERLPLNLHQALFVRLLQPTINCLTSSNYVKIFRNFKSNAGSLTENQKLYLLKCPYFLTTYNGPHIEKAMEQILETMLPRYVTILDEHMKSIQEWKRPIMRALHNLIITIVYAEGYFSSYTYTESFRILIKHLLNILNEQTLIKKIHVKPNNIETLLIDATLVVFNVLIYEPNALDYVKQCRPTKIFRQLTKTPYETIVLNAYMMLAYMIDENELRVSSKDSIQLLSTTADLLRKTMATRKQMKIEQNFNSEDVDRSTLQLLETLKGLAQYEQIRQEISKQNILEFLIDYYKELRGLSRQVLLECLWKLSFNKQLAQQLREHRQFILILESFPKLINDTLPTNTLRRSSSYSNRRNGMNTGLIETINYEIQKVVDGLLWKIVKEPQFREKMNKLTAKNGSTDQQKYKYDIMISFSHADKDIVQRIQQILTEEGYTVWSEYNHKHGQAMQIVAEVIENSEFVMICMSDSYKRDSYCQAQAEYALTSKRHLLPLIVYGGYKPDGWLNDLLSNRLSIDFGASSFKAAAELLFKEIKQRQRKKGILDVKQIVRTPVNIVRNSSTPLAIFNKPVASPELSVSNEATFFVVSPESPANINRQQLTLTHSLSRSSTPGANISTTPILLDRQQPTPTHSLSRSSTPGANVSTTPILLDRQQPTPTHPLSRSSTPGANVSPTPVLLDRQQPTPTQPIPRSFTPGANTSPTPTIIDRRQQQASVRFSPRPALPTLVYTIAPIIVSKRQQIPVQPTWTPSTADSTPYNGSIAPDQQLTVSKHSTSKSPTSEATPSNASATTMQQQQLPGQLVSRSPTPGSIISFASDIDNKQQQTSVHSISRSATANSISSVAPVIVNQQQQATANSLAKPSTPSIVLSDASVSTEKKHQEQQPPTPYIRRTPETNSVPSTEYTAVSQRYSMHPGTRSLTNDATSSVTSAAVDKKQQQQFRLHLASQSPTPSFSSSNEPIRGNKEQQQKVEVHLIPSMPTTNGMSSPTSAVSAQHYHQTLVQSNSKTTIPSVVSAVDDQQQQQTTVHSIPKSSVPISDNADKQQREPASSISRSTTPASSVLVTCNGIQKQQQQMPSRSNSRSQMDATLPNGSSSSLALPTSSQSYSREQLRLSEQYLNRKTQNSTYHTRSINSWRNNDVLDFLFDNNLHTMMPLCESMSGRALVQLFRMCHKKPSRLYDQLNQELRDRFKGLTLPMGVYTQFLIEMDVLVDAASDALPSVRAPAPKLVERVILMPRTVQQEQLVARQASPRSTISTISSNYSNTVTPPNSMAGTATPRNTRVVERAIYRPASNIGRPYNFIIESVEEPTVLLSQVQRYGDQLLLLDATARQHRELQAYS